MAFRAKELEKFKLIGLTKESYGLLRVEKKKQKRSMMRIVDNLIQERYGKNNSAVNGRAPKEVRKKRTEA